jgi:hypothetical protein
VFFFLGISGAKNRTTAIPSFTTGDVSIFRQALYKDGAAKITKDLCLHDMLPESVEFLSPSQAGGFSGNEGAVRSVANQMELKTGKKATLKEAATELGSRGNEGAVRSVANQMELKTGKKATLKEAATELGSRGKQGLVRSFANQIELKTGVMPSLEAAASEMASTNGRKSVGKPRGKAVWAKVVQISGSDEEILGTEKCADIKLKICAELCHQGIGLLYSTCFNQYIGMWFKYAGESADNSTIIFHRKAGNKRWKLTILTAKPTNVKEVCEQVYLKESKTFRESNAKKMVKSRHVKKAKKR